MDIHFDIRNHRYSDSLEILIISTTDRKNALAQRYSTRKNAKFVYGESAIARRIFSGIGQAHSIFFKIGTHNLYDIRTNLAEETPPGIDVSFSADDRAALSVV